MVPFYGLMMNIYTKFWEMFVTSFLVRTKALNHLGAISMIWCILLYV